jgi:hypothetical protein
MRCWCKTVLLLPLLAGGCVTHKLWTESRLDSWNEPADIPALRLFHDEHRQGCLVVYDELSGRADDIRTRAFFLNQNVAPLAQRIRPHFVSADSSRGLTPVPIFFSVPTNAPEFFCTTMKTNGGSFALFSAGQQLGSFELPVYDDGWGRVEKIAWTPLAVTADLTIIGGYLGCWWIYSGGPGLGR